MKRCQHVQYWVFHDSYTAATKGGRDYSYEEEPVSSDKEIQREGVYTDLQ